MKKLRNALARQSVQYQGDSGRYTFAYDTAQLIIRSSRTASSSKLSVICLQTLSPRSDRVRCSRRCSAAGPGKKPADLITVPLGQDVAVYEKAMDAIFEVSATGPESATCLMAMEHCVISTLQRQDASICETITTSCTNVAWLN
jgi:hypothetical protein